MPLISTPCQFFPAFSCKEVPAAASVCSHADTAGRGSQAAESPLPLSPPGTHLIKNQKKRRKKKIPENKKGGERNKALSWRGLHGSGLCCESPAQFYCQPCRSCPLFWDGETLIQAAASWLCSLHANSLPGGWRGSREWRLTAFLGSCKSPSSWLPPVLSSPALSSPSLQQH